MVPSPDASYQGHGRTVCQCAAVQCEDEARRQANIGMLDFARRLGILF